VIAAPVITVLSKGQPELDQALCKFAQFLGLQTEIVSLSGPLEEMPSALEKHVEGGRMLCIGHAALDGVSTQPWFSTVLGSSRFAFVYGFQPDDRRSRALAWLTEGVLNSVTNLEASSQKRFMIHADVTHNAFPVSGGSYSLDSGQVAVFSGPSSTLGLETYISVNGHPQMVSVGHGEALVFLFAGEGLVDIDTPQVPNASLRPFYSELIALALVLRTAGGTSCWTSPVTAASFIIDDPYLRKRYGFIRYDALMGDVEMAAGSLTVAFIPFNYRRSDRRTIELLRQYPGRFSIAVHGCDHTQGEYASKDGAWLAGMTSVAVDRMDEHTRLTGLPYDKVMIFPQGRFSIGAIGALKHRGFDAVVNTTPWPLDAADDPLTVRDLLQVAITHYEGFPIFARRYPDDLFEYRFDALFQKPILATEHHEYIRRGYQGLADVVRSLTTAKTNATWMPLGRALASSCLLKQTGDGRFIVRQFSRVLHLSNPTSIDWHLSVQRLSRNDPIRCVIADRSEIPYEVVSDQLRYDILLPAGRSMVVEIIAEDVPPLKWPRSLKYRLGASLRRFLSDVRDNHLAQNKKLLAVAQRIKATLRP
jgi:hypothetical protein